MDSLLFTLLIITIIILIVAIAFLFFVSILMHKKLNNDQKDIIIKSNHDAMNTANEINMRLIAILTEVTTGNPPMSQEDISNYKADIRTQDKEIVKDILNPEPSKPFDPYANIENDEVNQDSNDLLHGQSAIYNLKEPDSGK